MTDQPKTKAERVAAALRELVHAARAHWDKIPVRIHCATMSAEDALALPDDPPAAQPAGDGWAALRKLRLEGIRREAANQRNFAAGVSPCKDKAMLDGCTAANLDWIDAIDDLLVFAPPMAKENPDGK